MEIRLHGQWVTCTPEEYARLIQLGVVGGTSTGTRIGEPTQVQDIGRGTFPKMPDEFQKLPDSFHRLPDDFPSIGDCPQWTNDGFGTTCKI